MARATALLALLPVVVAACGIGPRAASVPSCSATVRTELAAVTRRIHTQVTAGRLVSSDRKRLARSAAFGRAVAAHDAAAAKRIATHLLGHRVVDLAVDAGGRPLTRIGTKPVFAPVRGTIADHGRPVGTYVLTVSDRHAFTTLTRHLAAMPPSPASLCGPTPAATRLNTIGLVARRVMATETAGPGATGAVRHAEKDMPFRRAVLSGSRSATWHAIVGFFRDKRFHIVRVRAWRHGRLVDDVGGPFVLSPAAGRLRGGGRFLLAVQDDTGFVKLVHRFTGADVGLRVGHRHVPGSAPQHAGRVYRFAGRAFPNGALRVTLQMP